MIMIAMSTRATNVTSIADDSTDLSRRANILNARGIDSGISQSSRC